MSRAGRVFEWSCGPTTAAERRQADLFFADLLGRSASPRRRRGGAIRRDPESSSLAEQGPSASLVMRGGGIVGNTPAATNVREDVLNALDRMHTLWSITNDDYGREYPRIAALPTGSRVRDPEVNLRHTLAAIRRNRHDSLSAQVMRNFFEIDVAEGVGSEQPNRTADVRKLQVVLVALGMLADGALTEGVPVGSSVPPAAMSQTLAAIRKVKARLAAGTLGWDPIHADELESGGDRFGGRTYEFQDLSVFVPRGARSDRSDVHVFFSPGAAQGSGGLNAVLHHGLRAAGDGSAFVLIGVPGADPGYVTIETAQIEAALRRVGRSTSIGRLRLSAHSRGGRGLWRTIARRLIDISKIDRVVILDCGWGIVASTLAGARIPASKVVAYRVIDDVLPPSAGRTVQIEQGCSRAIGYSRLILDAMRTRPSLTIPREVRDRLLALPARGQLRAASVPLGAAGSFSRFCADNARGIRAILSGESTGPHGLRVFVEPPNDLGRLGRRYTTDVYAHHFFVCEIAHEITS